jgi:serine/threonine protein kinase
MAPEQVRGDKSVNASADLFALGCVLYKALTGRDAFAGAEIMEILARLLLENPPPVEDLVVDLPPRFAHLIGSLMSKDAASRLGDSAIACTELRAIRRGLENHDEAALAMRPDDVPAPAPRNSATAIVPRRGRRWPIAAGFAVSGRRGCRDRADRGGAPSCSETVYDGWNPFPGQRRDRVHCSRNSDSSAGAVTRRGSSTPRCRSASIADASRARGLCSRWSPGTTHRLACASPSAGRTAVVTLRSRARIATPGRALEGQGR